MSNPDQGAYKTLVQMLKAAPSMDGVSVAFGEEYERAEEFPLPLVVIVPGGGDWTRGLPGYLKQDDPDVYLDNIWTVQEQCQIWMWAAADPNANPTPTAVDNADAIENLRCNVLRAFQTQAPTGLFFVPISGQWSLFQGQFNRYGRGYALNVRVDITYTTALPVDVTITDTNITAVITDAA